MSRNQVLRNGAYTTRSRNSYVAGSVLREDERAVCPVCTSIGPDEATSLWLELADP